MSLNSQLQQMFETSNAKFPPEMLKIIAAAQEETRQLGIETTARGVGDYLAETPLKDVKGNDVILSTLNENGPMIVTFYRGGWCPYCNMELRTYQADLDKITAVGGSLVAITPEKPDSALSTAEKNALAFPVLTDEGNAFAKAMGIAFELPLSLQEIFGHIGVNLPELNAETGWALPVPATFVVDCTHRIVLAHVDVDYTRRLEPSAAIAALCTCAHPAAQTQGPAA